MRWTRGPVIGRGSSAIVSLATTSTNQILAVKSSEVTSSTSLQNEQYLLSQLQSHHIIQFIGCDITSEDDKTMYNVLLEYMPGGSLADLARKHWSGGLSESLIQVYMYQILKGLEYLHSNGIVHCDIKGQNILIGKNNIKIADLGCAKIVEKSGNAKNMIFSGTPLFMAPEVARGEEQGFPADIWSMGCTFLEIATGRGGSPWPELTDPVSALYKIGYSGDVPNLPAFLSDNAKDFLSKCFKIDAKERWTAEQLVNHPFFNGVVENLPAVVQNSPTSILDQGIWSSMDAAESSSSSSSSSGGPIQNVVSFSPAGRIKQLSLLSDSMLPNWTENESWITVRGFVSQEINHVFQLNLDVNEELMDTDGSWILGGQPTRSSASCDYLYSDDYTPLDHKSVTTYQYDLIVCDYRYIDYHTICRGKSGVGGELELEVDSEFSLDSFYFEEVNDRGIVYDGLLFSQFDDDININETLAYRISSLGVCDNVVDCFTSKVGDFEEMKEVIYYCNCCVFFFFF